MKFGCQKPSCIFNVATNRAFFTSLQLIRSHPCLYNAECADYRNREMQEDAWSDVSKNCGESEDLCRKRWRNLKTSTARYLKQRRSGIAKDIKEYYLYDDMKFMIPHLKSKDSCDLSSFEYEETSPTTQTAPTTTPRTRYKAKYGSKTLKTEKLKNEDENSYDHYEIAVIDGNESYILSRPEDNEEVEEMVEQESDSEEQLEKTGNVIQEGIISTETYDVIAEEPPAKLPKLDSSSGIKTLKITEVQHLHQPSSPAQILAPLAQAPQPESSCPDEMFMKSLLPDIKSMTKEQKRKFKIKVLSLVDEILSN